MLIIKIITVGRVKEKWLNEALQEYEKRLSSILKIIWHLAKTDKELCSLIAKEKQYICLDIEGNMLSSDEFSKKLFTLFTTFGHALTFVIGGAEGLSQNIKTKAYYSFSLSKLTFTHQMTRLILLEQFYRAIEISKNSRYHK
jgi:23S rRNA (pseudouridine1915-N3)-methyltransferase